MDLLRGEPALRAGAALMAGASVPVLAPDPRARQSHRLQVLAIADSEHAVLIDAQGTPGLATLFESDLPCGAYDAKEVQRALLATCGTGPRRWACVRLSEQLLQGGRDGSLELEAIAKRHGAPTPPSGAAGFAELGNLACAVARLIAEQVPLIRRDGLTWASRIEAAAVSPIAAMEHDGMPFDRARWLALHRDSEAERDTLRQTLLSLLGGTDKDLLGAPAMRLDHDPELKAALARLGHEVSDLRRQTLELLPAPLGPKLARYRELGKLVSAYGEAFLAHVAGDDRLHPTFEQIGASTGRLSCHAPNLQSIVKDAPHRECFRALPARRLVIGDYATCELRILAEMSGDPVFADAFARNEDLHAQVASRVFGKPVSKTENPELRERAKAVNFGLCYGMGAAGLARAVGTNQKQAEELLARYFKTFPLIRGFLERSAEEALGRGHAATLTGRRLYLDAGQDRSSRAQAERIAKNMPIQGTSADITKIALARLHTALRALGGARLCNTVHDEIVVECEATDAEAVAVVLEREMRRAGEEVLKHVPVKVDVAVSQHWRK